MSHRLRRRARSSLWTVALVAGLTGCAPTRPQPYQRSLVPPGPAPVRSASTAEPRIDPPTLEPRLFIRDQPPAVHLSPPPVLAPVPPELIRRAERAYQNGRRRTQAGDEEGARREFDRAIDLLLSAPEDLPERSLVEKKLEDLVEAIHRFDLAELGAGDVESEPGFEKSPLEEIPQMTFPIDPRLKNRVQEQVRAMVSQLPIEVNDAVLSYINYFSSTRGRKILVTGLERAGQYRAQIRRILDEEGVPQELISLAQAESGFRPRAVSRKKAAGMWQFVSWRGREYGLTQTAHADARLDPEKATRAAARHLRDLYHQFGDWYLAMVGYNSGPGTVQRAIERTGYADFWEFRRRNVLPKETANYVPIILAMVIMTKNPGEYGLEDVVPDPPLEYDTVEMSAPTSLLLISDLTEAPISQLRALNPALLKNVAPPGHPLRVPKGSAVSLLPMLESIPAGRQAAWRAHRVEEDDTLASIARRFRVSVASLAEANRINGEGPEPGDLLLVPVAAQPVRAKAPSGPVRASSAKRKATVASRTSPRTVTSRVRASAAKRPAGRARPMLTKSAQTAQARTRRTIVNR